MNRSGEFIPAMCFHNSVMNSMGFFCSSPISNFASMRACIKFSIQNVSVCVGAKFSGGF